MNSTFVRVKKYFMETKHKTASRWAGMLIISTLLLFSSALLSNARRGEFGSDTTEVKGKSIKSLKADLTFIQANDLGRNGYYLQKPIAELMGEVADVIGPEAILAAGDVHHFMGVQSTTDPLWLTNFETIYSHPELMIPWYPVLGNHEYIGNTEAVINYSQVSRRWQMEGRYYYKLFTGKSTRVHILFIDTTPLISRYREESNKYADVLKVDPQQELKWIEEQLSAIRGSIDKKSENEQIKDWIIVVGHHPVYAQTSKSISEQEDLQKSVAPLLRKYGVDIYTCGHIHNFQHFREKESNVEYVVNSAASLSREKVKKIPGALFVSGEAGFIVISADLKSLTLSMINSKGEIIYTIEHK